MTTFTNIKFLEVITNSILTWDDQTKTISIQLSTNIGFLAKIRHNIPSITLIQLYQTLVQPYLVYCNIIWAAGSNLSLTRLFIKQRKLFVSSHTWSGLSIPYKFLPSFVYQLYMILINFQLAVLYTNHLTVYCLSFCDIFDINYDIHDHNTRHKSDIRVIAHRIRARTMCIKVCGAELWNSLHHSMKKSNSYR